MFNVGTDLDAWFILGKFAISILAIVWVFRSQYFKPAIRVALLGVLLLFLWVFFGPGDVHNPKDRPKEGLEKMQEEALEQAKPLEQVRKETEENKPDALKRQADPSPAKEIEEAEALLKEGYLVEAVSPC